MSMVTSRLPVPNAVAPEIGVAVVADGVKSRLSFQRISNTFELLLPKLYSSLKLAPSITPPVLFRYPSRSRAAKRSTENDLLVAVKSTLLAWLVCSSYTPAVGLAFGLIASANEEIA